MYPLSAGGTRLWITPCFSSGTAEIYKSKNPGGMTCGNNYTTRRPSGTDF